MESNGPSSMSRGGSGVTNASPGAVASSRHAGTTPRGHLRRIRLDRAHAELKTADPSSTVSAVAMKWGFAHQGRFAAAYCNAYDVPPFAALQDADC
ncbi:helix-turn-helix domain-containing protein [Streptomyces sp. NPDC056508]|uniref:helix-turn-helix domain-containing protein n=1 Tax=Streptomyces sp. NPDC056508 TaxID=3345845 RepID=UPI0036782E7E